MVASGDWGNGRGLLKGEWLGGGRGLRGRGQGLYLAANDAWEVGVAWGGAARRWAWLPWGRGLCLAMKIGKWAWLPRGAGLMPGIDDWEVGVAWRWAWLAGKRAWPLIGGGAYVWL